MEPESAAQKCDHLSSLGLDFFIARYGIEFSRHPDVRIGGLSFGSYDQCLASISSVLSKDVVSPNNSGSTPSGPTHSDPARIVDEILCSAAGNNEMLSPAERILWYLGYIFSGGLEPVLKRIDRQQKRSFVRTAFSDSYCNSLFSAICNLHLEAGQPFVFKTFWPEGRPYAVSLTHDVDETKKTYQWITRPIRLLLSGNFHGLCLQARSFIGLMRGREPCWTFDTLTETEKKYDCVSSFYFLHETAPASLTDRSTWRHLGRRYDLSSKAMVQVIRDLAGEGFEVGLHGSFCSFTDNGLLQKEKTDLESVLGTPVKGCRQHNLNLSIPDTWRIQERAGLVYDTTLGFNDCVGFRWGTCLPFHPCDPALTEQMDLLEIPLAIEDLPFFLEEDLKKTFLSVSEEVARYRGVLTLLWHHNVINPLEYPGWGDAYEKMIQYAKKKGAWVTSGKNIAEWWIERENLCYSSDFSEKTLIITVVDASAPVYLSILYPEILAFKSVENATVITAERNCLNIRAQITPDRNKITVTFEGAMNGC